MNPLTFFALGAAIAMIVFNVFVEDYVRMGTSINESQLEPLYNFQKAAGITIDFETFKNEMKVKNENFTKNIIKYFNLFSFVLLPLYTLMSFLVFWRRSFFGEHLVINAFVQGTTFWFVLVLFGLAMLFSNPWIFMVSSVFIVFYYLYVYGVFYKLKLKKVIMYFFKFFGVLIGAFLLMMVLSVILGFFLGGMLL
ncbi:MAG: hypothetical protein JKY08_06440 [Flavobacteriaceae bacterium]|nr:hypothetical protein [Flavobacteriaceae bacterium]